MIFSKGVYDKLKFLAQIALPAVGALYAALAALWGLPDAEQVVGTVVAVDFFLGTILGISTKAYNDSDAKYDGQINITEDDNKKLFQLDIPGDPHDLQHKDEVVLKINPPE